jgi:hypothetical protein
MLVLRMIYDFLLVILNFLIETPERIFLQVEGFKKIKELTFLITKK